MYHFFQFCSTPTLSRQWYFCNWGMFRDWPGHLRGGQGLKVGLAPSFSGRLVLLSLSAVGMSFRFPSAGTKILSLSIGGITKAIRTMLANWAWVVRSSADGKQFAQMRGNFVDPKRQEYRIGRNRLVMRPDFIVLPLRELFLKNICVPSLNSRVLFCFFWHVWIPGCSESVFRNYRHHVSPFSGHRSSVCL